LRKSKAAEYCRTPNVAVLANVDYTLALWSAAVFRRFSNELQGIRAHYLGLQKIRGGVILIIPLPGI